MRSRVQRLHTVRRVAQLARLQDLELRTPNPELTQESWTTIIEPSHGWSALQLGELWRYRELLYFLAWRDVKVRYKQTVLGVAWAVVQPLVTMVVFTVVFGHFAHIPSDGVPYAIFSYAGLLP